MSTSSPPLIEIRGGRKSFGSNVILDGVDLTIHAGEALVIIGPSGTGKSTLLRLIAGLLTLDEGEMSIKGQLQTQLWDNRDPLLRFSMVFQQAALFDSLTVRENVGFMLYEHTRLPPSRIEEQVEQMLEQVGLEGTAELYPAELSGGMRKRVSFARALMHDPSQPNSAPELILYDEPTAGLDPIASTIIEDLVRQLQNHSCGTYVMVSHQRSTIKRTADRIVFLYSGKVQWTGTVNEIETSDNPLIQQFFAGSVDGPIRVAI
ncbi:MAG: ABC transporter ATP-binding protein [Cyanobacteria bacterium P01_H01_bin.15]